MFRLLIISILFVFFGCRKSDINSQEKTGVDTFVINPVFRIKPKPANNTEIKTNPPIFLIPLVNEKKMFEGGIPEIKDPILYSFRLSQDENFRSNKSIELIDSPWAVFNPHKKLANGTWFWQYKSNKSEWSETLKFQVSENIPVFETPTFEELLTTIPTTHPRILSPGNIEDLRKRNLKNEDSKRLIEKAEEALNLNPPREDLGAAKIKGSTKVENNKLALDASRNLGALVQTGMDPLTKAYVLTGNEKYAQATIAWALKVATFDPNGASSTNNFGDSECMFQLAMVYDACFNILSNEEKELILSNVVPRASRFYMHWKNMLEAKVFSGHVWQHILEREFKTAAAIMDEVPEAKIWLNFIYDLYLARNPVLGPDDGGWWNGNHYVELNGITLLDIPMYLNLWTGIDFLQSPFYNNHPFWLIYSFPANSYSEGFGNGTEKQFGQKLGVLGFMDALGRIKQNPYATWYSKYQLKHGALLEGWDPAYFGHLPAVKGHTIYDDDEFRWFRIKWNLPNPPELAADIDKLPLARAFRETGTANMHTNLLNAHENLMVSLRSSPYGSTSHSHADQNSFNIQFGGEKLFYNSGHRPSMGVPHYVEWFKATVGHNSILIDGKGQPGGSGESYGWLPRFLHCETISYVLGDASKAYDNKFNEVQKVGLKLFRRHLVFLRPSIIIVYDELEADHDAEWTWLLHSPFEINLNNRSQTLGASSTKAKSRVDQFGSGDLEIELGTEFDPKPINFRQMKGPDGKILEFQDQWHIYSRPKQKAEKFRYLTIFQINPINDIAEFIEIKINNGKINLGDWEIFAELDVSKEASFSISNQEEKKAIVYNVSELKLSNKRFRPEKIGSTMLIEIQKDGEILEEAGDEFPKGRD